MNNLFKNFKIILGQNYQVDEIKPTEDIDWNSTIKDAMEVREEEEQYDFTDDDKNLCFYWLDAHEAQWKRDGKLYLTGRMRKPEGGTQSGGYKNRKIWVIQWMSPIFLSNFSKKKLFPALAFFFEKFDKKNRAPSFF